MNQGKLKKIGVTTTLGLLVFVISFIVGAPLSKPVQGFVDDIFLNEKRSAVIGETAIVVLVAENDKNRKKGLSGKSSLGEYEGMLFVFEESLKHGIWMKDMNFPIDIIWLNDLNEVIHLEERISPETFPKVFYPNKSASYVLEVSSGFIDKYKIRKGDLFTSL